MGGRGKKPKLISFHHEDMTKRSPFIASWLMSDSYGYLLVSLRDDDRQRKLAHRIVHFSFRFLLRRLLDAQSSDL